MDSFLKNAICLGDVLRKDGYYQVFMQGTSTDFSGIRNFYKTHKFNEIYGRKELKKRLKDKSYINEWGGLYDDSLLPMAYKKFIELSKDKKPFVLILATIDTHHPNGMVSKSCQNIPYKNGENPILNAVHCSDKLITEFINKIRNSKYAKNTLIVLSSDHLAMRNSATNLLEKGKRRDLFLIFDPKNSMHTVIKKPGSILDVAPTVLYKMGINTDLGLGRNLIKKSSLLTKFKHFNQKLLSWQKDILKLWDFEKIGLFYRIDLKRQSVYINEHQYKFPTLIKVNDNRSITPYFEFDYPKHLDEYLIEFPKKQKFIWIDRCTKLNRVFKLKLKAKFCLIQGSLGSNLETIALKKKKEIIDTENLFKSSNFDEKLYTKRLENIHSFQKCYKPPKNKILLLSASYNVLSTVYSAIKIDNESFEISRGLNLLTLDNSGKYKVEQFDVYGSENSAKKFLQTIQFLIKQNKPWAVVVHDAVKNSYPGYKEKLKKLGFKLLPKLNFRTAYIGFQDKNGTIHEFSDEKFICKFLNKF